jgi:hypothetical protein
VAAPPRRKANAGLRGKWARAVIGSLTISPPAARVAWALSLWMTDDGVVAVNRREVAEALGWKTVQRVTDRIGELRRAGFLGDVGGGRNGQVARYQAQIPLPARQWMTAGTRDAEGTEGATP